LVITVAIVAVFGVPLATPVAAQDATPAACPTTTPEENEALARMYWAEAVWGKQGKIADVVAPNEIHHWGIGGDTTGFDAFAQGWAHFNQAFPDLTFTVDDIVAEGDLVATRWTATGTQSGEFQGIAPTNKEVSWSGINVFRIACGQIAESWGEADHIGLRRALGATDVPAAMATPQAESAAPVAAATPCASDTPAANTALARRWAEDVWTGQDLDAVDDLFASEAVHHGAAFPDVQGPAAIKQAIHGQLAAFPDIDITVDQTIAADDRVAVRWSGTATHQGLFMGVAPTGQTVHFTGINFYRFSCGKIVDSWSEMNALDILRQLREAAGTPTP
jgi:steroid delta-isomerase-like uncharacterized protein